MSGGSYDYAYQNVEQMAFDLKKQKCPLRNKFGLHLIKVAKAMHDIEWVDSDDYATGAEIKSIMEVVSCEHKWIVTTNEKNEPEDVMCENCKEVRIMVDHKNEK